MEANPQRRSTVSGQSPTPSSLRHCLYPSPVATIEPGSKSLRHNSKSKNKSAPLRPAALTRVKDRIAMETPTRIGTELSWLHDASPMERTPQTPQRSRSHTPEPNTTSIVNPSSVLLQDLLKEQRATRGSRTVGIEEAEGCTPRTPEWCHSQSLSQSQSQSQSRSQGDQSSEKQEKSKMSASASVRQPRDMGVRETDKYISKISKQNFDLKLEIFHRVQQVSALEKKLQRMRELEEELQRMRSLEDELQELRAAEEDNQRLRESNEQLRQEIDKRDQAVTEAVELICQLEAKVEELEMAADISPPSTARLPMPDGPDVTTPKKMTTLDIPERTSSKRGVRLAERRRVSSGSRHLQRAPSFLLEENKSTAALRSLYVQAEELPASEITMITKSESMNSMDETIEPESPRLSALSECSELNINDSVLGPDGFDEIEIPVRKRDTSKGTTNLSSITLGNPDRDIVHINRWVPEQPDDTIVIDMPSIQNQPLSDVFSDNEIPTFDSGSFSNPGHKNKLETIFGGARLPPTPDTMSTAYAGWINRSSSSTVADKAQADLKRYLTRTHSADEITMKRSSINSAPLELMDTNLSDITLPRASLDERDEDPAIVPLNSIQPRYGYSASHSLFAGDFEKVLARMEKQYYSPSRRTIRDGSASSGSSPTSLTAEDWIEAARSGTRTETERTSPTGHIPVNSRLVGARAPSQSSFLGRRHSIDSAVREPDLPIIQTLNLHSLEDDSPPTEPDPEPRRKLSLLPPFFSRSATARRLQPSPISDPVDGDDGAPAPVIRKTRNHTSKVPRPLSGHGTFGPTYADLREETMSRSLTEANFLSSTGTSLTMARPSTSNGKDHKRRGSLGIFGWMKGASAGLGSLKKSDAAAATGTDRPITPTSASGITSVRTSSRLTTHENATLTLETVKHVEPVVDDFATRTRHPVRTDEPADEQGRRPRYMERRPRRT